MEWNKSVINQASSVAIMLQYTFKKRIEFELKLLNYIKNTYIHIYTWKEESLNTQYLSSE